MSFDDWTDQNFADEAKALTRQYNTMIDQSHRDLSAVYRKLLELITAAQDHGLRLNYHSTSNPIDQPHPSQKADIRFYRIIDL